MNKKYIDFVPATKPEQKGAEKAKTRNVSSAMVNRGGVRKVAKRPAVKKVKEVEEISIESIFAEKPRPAGVSSGSKGPKLGVIEDLSPKFVKNAEVNKRPLSSRLKKNLGGISRRGAAKVSNEAESAAEAKAKKAKLSAKKAAGLESIFEAALKDAKTTEDKKTAKIPKTTKTGAERPRSPFVNTEKVNKRPLSKNVYQKKAVVPAKEEPSGPVTIIAKPEKDSRVGTVVAIVITIVLGATAGTVAFLLLPK